MLIVYQYIPCHALNTIYKKVMAVTISPKMIQVPAEMDPELAGVWPTL